MYIIEGRIDLRIWKIFNSKLINLNWLGYEYLVGLKNGFRTVNKSIKENIKIQSYVEVSVL